MSDCVNNIKYIKCDITMPGYSEKRLLEMDPSSNTPYDDLQAKLDNWYQNKTCVFTMSWKDEEDDDIVVSSNREVQAVLAKYPGAPNSTLKMNVTDCKEGHSSIIRNKGIDKVQLAVPGPTWPSSIIRKDGAVAWLNKGKKLVSKYKTAQLVMSTTGNLSLYRNGANVWNTNTTGDNINKGLEIQKNGNMVLWGHGKMKWQSYTAGNTVELELLIQDNDVNTVALYNFNSNGAALWHRNSHDYHCGDFVGRTKLASEEWPSSIIRPKGTEKWLPAGSQLVSENGRVKLVMQHDGNLVLCITEALWGSNTYGKNVDSGLKIQADGNMVLYADGSPIWSSDTSGNTDSVELVLEDDCNLVLYNSENDIIGKTLWATGTNIHNQDLGIKLACEEGPSSIIRPKGTEKVLSAGSQLVSKNGRAKLVMQHDGNMALYSITPVWASDTYGKNVDSGLKIEADGNMVLCDDGTVVWESNTSGNPETLELVLQDDCNLVLYNSEDIIPIWDSDEDGSRS